MKRLMVVAMMLGMVGPALADSIDDAEAKRRGVPVETVVAERMAKRTPSTSPSTAPATAASQPFKIVYKKIKRSDAWFEDAYKKCRLNIVKVDGKFYDVGEAMISDKARLILPQPPAIGTVCRPGFEGRYSAKVEGYEGGVAIVGRAEIRSRRASPGLEGARFRVSGLDQSKYPDGATIDEKLIYVGVQKGRHEVLQEYRTIKPVTKEEFAEAVAADFPLMEYKITKVKVERVVGGYASGFSAASGKKTRVEEDKVVAIPIK